MVWLKNFSSDYLLSASCHVHLPDLHVHIYIQGNFRFGIIFALLYFSLIIALFGNLGKPPTCQNGPIYPYFMYVHRQHCVLSVAFAVFHMIPGMWLQYFPVTSSLGKCCAMLCTGHFEKMYRAGMIEHLLPEMVLKPEKSQKTVVCEERHSRSPKISSIHLVLLFEAP